MTTMMRVEGADRNTYRIDPLYHLRFVYPSIIEVATAAIKNNTIDRLYGVNAADYNVGHDDLVKAWTSLTRFPMSSLDSVDQENPTQALEHCGFTSLPKHVQLFVMMQIGIATTSTAWYVFRESTNVGERPGDLVELSHGLNGVTQNSNHVSPTCCRN